MYGLEKSVTVIITVGVMALDFFGILDIVKVVVDIGTTIEMIRMEFNGNQQI